MSDESEWRAAQREATCPSTLIYGVPVFQKTLGTHDDILSGRIQEEAQKPDRKFLLALAPDLVGQPNPGNVPVLKAFRQQSGSHHIVTIDSIPQIFGVLYTLQHDLAVPQWNAQIGYEGRVQPISQFFVPANNPEQNIRLKNFFSSGGWRNLNDEFLPGFPMMLHFIYTDGTLKRGGAPFEGTKSSGGHNDYAINVLKIQEGANLSRQIPGQSQAVYILTTPQGQKNDHTIFWTVTNDHQLEDAPIRIAACLKPERKILKQASSSADHQPALVGVGSSTGVEKKQLDLF